MCVPRSASFVMCQTYAKCGSLTILNGVIGLLTRPMCAKVECVSTFFCVRVCNRLFTRLVGSSFGGLSYDVNTNRYVCSNQRSQLVEVYFKTIVIIIKRMRMLEKL